MVSRDWGESGERRERKAESGDAANSGIRAECPTRPGDWDGRDALSRRRSAFIECPRTRDSTGKAEIWNQGTATTPGLNRSKSKPPPGSPRSGPGRMGSMLGCPAVRNSVSLGERTLCGISQRAVVQLPLDPLQPAKNATVERLPATRSPRGT
jgi:hypothetical protein